MFADREFEAALAIDEKSNAFTAITAGVRRTISGCGPLLARWREIGGKIVAVSRYWRDGGSLAGK